MKLKFKVGDKVKLTTYNGQTFYGTITDLSTSYYYVSWTDGTTSGERYDNPKLVMWFDFNEEIETL